MKTSEFNSLLIQKNLTIATAESITAGLLSSSIASVSGASSVLKGGVVTYSAELKVKLLGVSPETLEKYSAESIETTIEMVKGLSRLGLEASLYVAITGVASLPVTDYKISGEVGQVYLAILYNGELFSFQEILQPESSQGTRNQIREKAVMFAFDRIATVIENSGN